MNHRAGCSVLGLIALLVVGAIVYIVQKPSYDEALLDYARLTDAGAKNSGDAGQ